MPDPQEKKVGSKGTKPRIADEFGTDSEADPLRLAQELIYDAWEEPRASRRVKLAKRALGISKLCADAHVILAEEARSPIAARQHYQRGVTAGERALSRKGLKSFAGRFWGILDTRPYMRARAGLALCLWEYGERDEAIGHCQDMLRLNPNDNQGMRYALASWLLAVRDHESLTKLLDDYHGDGAAPWPYTRSLLALRKGDELGAHAALREGWRCNPHVPAFLIGTKPVPSQASAYFTLGAPDEAADYARENREQWASTPGALKWLAEATRRLPEPRRR